MLQVHSFVFNAFEENTYILVDETKTCVIIDPGCYESIENKELSDFIAENQLEVKYILNTHCHIDHILGNHFTKEKYKAPLLIPEHEDAVLKAAKVYAPNYGLHQYHEATVDRHLKTGDVIKFGKTELTVLFVPGHSPGHVAFYNAENNVLMGGDVLFYNSIGRADLPGGNYNTLISSIQDVLYNLPDSTKVYPGHGPETTIGFEKKTNPFCAIV